MAELKYTCPQEGHSLTASNRDDLAKKIQEHVRNVHHQQMSEQEAKQMAQSAQRM